jgi:hypothetical protein
VAKSEERARTASFSEIDKIQREQHKEAVLEWEKRMKIRDVTTKACGIVFSR